MDRTEFIYGLRRELSGLADYEFVNETINYYENYFDTEIRKGKSESEVISALGDYRLIAKSIKASRGISSSSTYNQYYGDESDNSRNSSDYTSNKAPFRIPEVLRKILMACFIFIVVMIVLKVASILMPVVIVAIIAVFIYRFIRDNFLT